jgi:bifunctional non-homologous end joining protein LigD
VLLGVDGRSDFNGLHSRKHNDEVQLYAFDILAMQGEDLRPLPLHLRKNNLARLLARRVDGIFVSDFEQGEIGPDLFRHACMMGLEGLVSKHRDRPYRGGRSPHWIKVKNRTHHSINRQRSVFLIADITSFGARVSATPWDARKAVSFHPFLAISGRDARRAEHVFRGMF